MNKLVIFLLGMLVAVLLAAGGGMLYIHSGSFGIAADEEHHPLVHWVFRTTRRHSISMRDRQVEVRMPELDHAARLEAVAGYEDMCAGCHAPPGRDASALERGLNPPPSDLTTAADRYDAKKLFWVTKHGIKMSGMPAWGLTHTDEELWELVALLHEFPAMEGGEYARMLEEAREAGVEHVHDHDHDHDH